MRLPYKLVTLEEVTEVVAHQPGGALIECLPLSNHVVYPGQQRGACIPVLLN
jgi:hypothetical protein